MDLTVSEWGGLLGTFLELVVLELYLKEENSFNQQIKKKISGGRNCRILFELYLCSGTPDNSTRNYNICALKTFG